MRKKASKLQTVVIKAKEYMGITTFYSNGHVVARMGMVKGTEELYRGFVQQLTGLKNFGQYGYEDTIAFVEDNVKCLFGGLGLNVEFEYLQA